MSISVRVKNIVWENCFFESLILSLVLDVLLLINGIHVILSHSIGMVVFHMGCVTFSYSRTSWTIDGLDAAGHQLVTIHSHLLAVPLSCCTGSSVLCLTSLYSLFRYPTSSTFMYRIAIAVPYSTVFSLCLFFATLVCDLPIAYAFIFNLPLGDSFFMDFVWGHEQMDS